MALILSKATYKVTQCRYKRIFFNLSDIDECLPNPCQNGGSCVDGTNDYKCSCVRGFGGVNCEISSASSSRISLLFPVIVNNVLLSDSRIQRNLRAEVNFI